ncbi:MAG: FprA family A-type flavoprotein [Bacteroidales bacterium]
MTKQTPATPLTPDVSWIGIQDYDLRHFDIVMETRFGTTYNSYFINAEKPAVIETAKAGFWSDYLAKLESVCNPADIAYIVMDHTEPDHSGCLKNLLALAPNAVVVGSGQALSYLQEIMGIPFNSLKVKDGDTLSLGNKTLRFIAAPNLHWPDSIYTFLEEEGILFTCDSFGAHYCFNGIFDDEIEPHTEAFDYYFDVILKPFSRFMLKAIEKIRPLPVRMIATGHGPVLRKDWKRWVERSEMLADEYMKLTSTPEKNLLILYVSAYGYTGEMARHIAEGASSVSGIRVECLDIEHTPLEVIDHALARSQGVVIGSPTINQNTLLPVYKAFAVMNPIRDRGKVAGAFGSYGWSGEAVQIIEANLKALKFKVQSPGLTEKFNPTEKKSEKFYAFGRELAKELEGKRAGGEQ